MSPKKKPAKKKPAKKEQPRKAASKPIKKVSRKSRKPVRRKSSNVRSSQPTRRRTQSSAEIESGDLQGLSNRERADSESVDELLEEGNAFEAGIVDGVQEADDSEGRGVHTREVPEDDVPEEYLDEE